MLRLCLSQCKVNNVLKENLKIFVNRQYGTRNPKKNQSLFVDKKNVFVSPNSDVDILEGSYMHEFVWKNVDKWWDKTALVCSVTDRSYTFGQLRRLSGRFATSLRKLKIKPGRSIAVVLPNLPEFAIVAMGASEAGIPLTLINPAYTSREINYQLENSEAEAVITVPSKYPTVAESISEVAAVQRHLVIVIQDGSHPAPPGIIKFEDLVADGVMEFEKTGEKVEIDATNDTVILPYSSGTTGLPKGVELTHKNLVANLSQLSHENCALVEPTTGNHQDVSPFFLPLYHIYGWIFFCHTLSNGGKAVTMPSFSSNGLIKVLEEHRITNICVAPPILQLMANDERFTNKHVECLRTMLSAAAPVGEEIIAKLRARVGQSFIFSQAYGLTEASPVITMGRDSPCGSVGRILPNTQVRLVGQSNNGFEKNLGVGEIGEIQARGPQIMKGYFKNFKATMETMDGEWLKTGDLGSFDDDGNLTITGRLKELIKVKGSQVSPAELEDLLHGHEKVADVAIIGVPHERFGEIPKAFVVTKKGVIVKEDEIKNYVSERVVDYKRLGQVVFVEKIPKNPSGKILRRELQKM